jgi:hypothetical protein
MIIEIQSSVLRSINYRFTTGVLIVQFRDGRQKVFAGVSTDSVRELVLSNSPGRYYQHEIATSFRQIAP